MKIMSKKWRVSATQWIKGLAIAIVPTIINNLIPMINNESSIDSGVIIKTSLTAALTYIGISFAQDSKGVPLGGADKK
jgi:hypothetical protein